MRVSSSMIGTPPSRQRQDRVSRLVDGGLLADVNPLRHGRLVAPAPADFPLEAHLALVAARDDDADVEIIDHDLAVGAVKGRRIEFG